jgi:cell division GTPase FtsZ
MRILAIGVGGAGSRIASSLYAADRKSSRVACVQSLAIDVDGHTLAKLTELPDSAKIYFPPLEPGPLDSHGDTDRTATIEIDEVLARIQNIESGETDAIFICCGLGGSMADVASHIVTALRGSIIEPIFGLFTLPCLSEGEKRSAKAADNIDVLSPLLDGIILFDNETWNKKIESQKTALIKNTGRKRSGILGFGKAKPEISPAEAARLLLNEGIVRRISLLLRAGEFKADGGIELAEVVMDSGEVLNTMKGMGFITIGYAVDHLVRNPLEFLSRWRPSTFFSDEHNKKASRIVELAKQAIYNEISTPCDITSATKALILVAGPSHELSMKGFMTVRKWIDRSIAGLETRSGDYPVTNTKYVAIIIMLSGLENIPRLTELKEIRAQYIASLRGSTHEPEDQSLLPGFVAPDTAPEQRDEMIILPGKKVVSGSTLRESGAGRSMPHAREKVHENPPAAMPVRDGKSPQKPVSLQSTPVPDHVQSRDDVVDGKRPTPPPSPAISPIPRRRLVVSSGQESAPAGHPVADATTRSERLGSLLDHPPSPAEKITPPSRVNTDHALRREKERHRIEHELQRQRMVVMGGHIQKKGTGQPNPPRHPVSFQETEISPRHETPVPDRALHGTSGVFSPPAPEKRTVIFTKKKIKPNEEPVSPSTKSSTVPPENTRKQVPATSQKYHEERAPENEGGRIGLKETMRRADDSVLSGKGVSTRALPRVKDDILYHTTLKSKKEEKDDLGSPHEPQTAEWESLTSRSRSIRKRDVKTDDIDAES